MLDGLPLLAEGAEAGVSEQIFAGKLVGGTCEAICLSLICSDLKGCKLDIRPVLRGSAGDLKGPCCLLIGGCGVNRGFALVGDWA